MSTQHTPGPWVIFGSQPILITDKNSREIAYVPVCLMDCDESQSLADACLIAAAPDLLAALTGIHEYLTDARIQEWLNRSGYRSGGYGTAIVNARAAIAKATCEPS